MGRMHIDEATSGVKLWYGDKHEYDALEEKDSDTCYMITESIYAPYRPSSVRYVCEYCGSEYYSSDGGFVPPCNGCGARLRRASDVAVDFSRYPRF